MKNYLNSKKIIITTILFSALIAICYLVIMMQSSRMFSLEVMVGIIKPMVVFAVSVFVISSFFIFFSQIIFISFLKRVVSWYLPILFYLTATTPIFSSHIMSVGRSVVVLYGMVLLGIIAVAYAFAMRKKVPV
ncbi:hypothetical protein A3I99_01580 [Candidatus Kaiserbacteria bacterium RIFCSPLOWO2_02_FULL_45_11b]|uniref:Uncharacterized protein n=1 Tax=Candidatus Kaiserbacteria bacterium RIFCSPLOWO2_12_FULL_45_26 TaxID=1798525 RepID=A0A1F6FFW7_9BACT|nr:MAG: hypothetical protein A2Z56_03920 [Candidatus Kaiserbacteria bacterium RIFCSPHIGHO2_12_45_16]OGG70521.1 MAG: hypothetical protein A2929_04825 [Candidatus Kaiserbacteria bacterium RIFCSPLOWO2_01_FULL_45_25]OGG81006.1 MAG: hypothetical protein A3I99_01580 [Candidatus Kaiserbacteria bacterium RIFCSPLOWO2_02_FULL_45_11b]OGG84749.1 MAG: hypothetical protein A3G90_01530 [Candidatus Kaiserbacteria bacterium RIFCSPLOWO2_12_FULL_45_26]